jgi:mortality factor 4-like protein 1
MALEYATGERVMAVDRYGATYEAKILAFDAPKKLYLVHYFGWSNKFDEFVDISRLSKLDRAPQGEGAEGGGGGEGAESAGADKEDEGSEMKKRKKALLKEATVVEELPLIATEISVEIPKLLRGVLFEDWKKIVGLGYLVSIPRRPSVSDIVRHYQEDVLAATPREPAEQQALRELCAGIVRYFDRALGLLLLYRVERLQYLDILESYPAVPMSQLYGAEHLLRMCVKLPDVTSLDVLGKMRPEEVFVLNSHMQSLIRYMVRRAGELFGGHNYENQAPEYQRLSSI